MRPFSAWTSNGHAGAQGGRRAPLTYAFFIARADAEIVDHTIFHWPVEITLCPWCRIQVSPNGLSRFVQLGSQLHLVLVGWPDSFELEPQFAGAVGICQPCPG